MRRTLFVLAIGLMRMTLGAEFEAPEQPSTSDPLRALQQFHVPAGFKVELFAAEPLLANPVAFTIDNTGKFYVAETHRHSAVGPAFRYFDGVLDIRSHLEWLDEDLALRSVPERVELLERRLGTNIARFTEKSEIVRLIQDKNGDGKADSSSIFATGFNNIADGIGAGVLARDGKVWFACIPDLWLLQDTNKDGKADLRTSLHTGYGVHISFLGHDLHGLKMGPDGRLYFSLGDRGMNVTNQEGRVLSYPDEGVVLRCELNGSNLEVFARGLRNPQELVFDQYGNLFTGDNNSDGGDRARWVYVVEGGDSGWRIGYQHIQTIPRRGPWNAERLWQPQWNGQAAYIVPPIANIGYGPSGNTFYPGTGLPERYLNHFFLCDFRGGASSGIHCFSLKPRGASFELESYEEFISECLPTDVDFGPDGALYFTDWVQGWNKTGKGRIFRVSHPESKSALTVAETMRLLRGGMAGRDEKELVCLLAHPDMRVRQEAQFELAQRGISSLPALQALAQRGANQLGRIHAIWALGQISRKEKNPTLLEPLLSLFEEPDAEICAQAVKTIGESALRPAHSELVGLLLYPSVRVQSFAATALAHYKKIQSLQPLLALLERNDNRDPYLRHAASFALAASASATDIAGLSTPTKASQLGVLLALRRLESPRVARFLQSEDLGVVLEAARAINDLPITQAQSELAALISSRRRFDSSATNKTEAVQKNAVTASVSSVAPESGATTDYEQLISRVINANFRLGLKENSSRLAEFAADPFEPVSLRTEAIAALADWARPSGRDRVMSLWRPLPERAPETAEFTAQLKRILSTSPEPVQLAAFEAVQKLHLVKAESLILETLEQESSPAPVRVRALRTLAALLPARIDPVLQRASESTEPALRSEARVIRAELHPAEARDELERVLASGSILEKQKILSVLSRVRTPDFAPLAAAQMNLLLDGKAAPELALDILGAAAQQGTPELLAALQRFENSRPKTNLAPFRETLAGGHAMAGRAIFFERADVFCSRCHTLGGEGGQAGPNLTAIGSRKSREYLLESILFPNKEIAQGFENVLVTTKDGLSVSGLVQKETTQDLFLNSPEDGDVHLKKTEIKSRQRALSGMPEEFRQILSKQDLRDLVEFLATEK
ncbi:MAG TPA: PVC-type heme-binding CxxCH protein [Verrucomicrobiae bacterium]|nr:PVC-type heme-binding CxxCH protein [Verrucomicrobiae bacterium]